MKLDGIHHIALNVKDLDRAERFYTEVLGFKVTHRFSKGLRHLMLDTGNAAIALFEAPDLDVKEAMDQLSEKGYLHLAFKIHRDRFPSIIEELKKNNVVIDGGPVKRGDGESIYFNDPDHNHLEIHCDH
ncbi:MAG: fosfomycin resistance glutathione transferase [Nitrospinaceae bacterium]|nr:MAG: fosfomycin resistance glutathione transferase [Nitrospinaceae bacterium]